MLLTTLCAGALFLSIPSAPADDFAEGLAIRGVVRSGRIPFPQDAVADAMANGVWKAPKEGDTLPSPSGEARAWTALKAGEDGTISQQSFGSGYAYFEVKREKPEIALLEASGHGMVYVNGEPRAGDPYGYGWHRLPVKLRAGVNEFLFAAGRGQLRAKLSKPKNGAFFVLSDATIPDLRQGPRYQSQVAGIVVVNASERTQRNLQVFASIGGYGPTTTAVPPIPPLTFRKVLIGFPGEEYTKPSGGTAKLRIELAFVDPSSKVTYDVAELELRVREPRQTYRRTFVSGIDGSVQYYAVNPAWPGAPAPRALILSLHGASVEAIGQADAYSSKSWADIVCPTNRRPFGFDWEDWGRLDALEVLAHAQYELKPDPSRIYLTGHSMGGHGAWSLGAFRPDLWAAIGPSAGWRSFYDYGGKPRYANPTPVEAILQRADLASDTVAFARNLLGLGVYVLHGDADDNVPVSEARAMRDLLKPIHSALGYHEQPGAGHWWESSDEPGAECVDWPAMFDFFAARRKPKPNEVREIDFATPNPGVASRYAWAEVLQQIEPLKLSQIKLRCDPHSNRITGATSNVALLAIRSDPLWGFGSDWTIELDGQRLKVETPSFTAPLTLERVDGSWRIRQKALGTGGAKSPLRNGPFKMAFQRGFALVYGTSGTAEESGWAYAKARFDAETFAYRGNGAPLVLSDVEFVDPKANGPFGHGSLYGGVWNVVLYGNANTNRIWNEMVGGNPPVRIERGQVTIGTENAAGDGLACLFAIPNQRVMRGMVACIGGTGLRGMRMTDRLPFFVSGVHYPDWVVMTPDLYRAGNGGVLGCGFFGNDWRYSPENSAWNWRP